MNECKALQAGNTTINTTQLDTNTGAVLAGGNKTVPLIVNRSHAYYLVAAVPDRNLPAARFSDFTAASESVGGFREGHMLATVP